MTSGGTTALRTAFLGPRGTFSEEAALLFSQGDGQLIPYASFPALTAAVEAGEADAAVLPIENSIEGQVHTTLDLLIHETPLQIIAEEVVPVRHMLVMAPGGKLEDIRSVASHPQGLGQCRRFLDRVLPGVEQEAALSTAGAVEAVATGDDLTRAAIGPLRAAELYQGDVIARDVQDVRGNLTRFVVLAPREAAPTGNDKTSIGLTVKANVPGILSKVLSPFAEQGIQLTKIESRPNKGWLGDYVFLLDFEGHRADPPVRAALEQVREYTAMLKVFGSYPRFPLEQFRDLVTASSGLPSWTHLASTGA
jgi:prephenate dehydratase